MHGNLPLSPMFCAPEAMAALHPCKAAPGPQGQIEMLLAGAL
jgi:hypothetical protein